MSKPIQIRLSGARGQGLTTAGSILAEAADLDGKYVIQTQTYCPETRLGSSKAEVIISDKPIGARLVIVPDVLICLTEEAVAKHGIHAHDETFVVIDSTVVGASPRHGQVMRLPITRAAVMAGGKIAANVVAIGVVNALVQVVSTDSLRAAVLRRVPEKLRDLNLRALEAAESLVSEALTSVA